MQKNSLSYCGSLVRTYDPDRFLLSMFAPPSVREDLWALFAFNHEISKTREVVSESTLGLIRLQWWRDAVAGIYAGKILEHEVIKPLAQAIKNHDLPQELFETLIYAREFDLENVLPGNLEGLMNYSDFTGSPLLKLAVKICGGFPETEPVQVVAINYGLAGVLRAVPFHARQGRCYLPEDLLEKCGVSAADIFSARKREELSNVAQSVAQAWQSGIKPETPILKAAQALSGLYMRHLKRRKYDLFSPKMALDPPFKVVKVLWAAKFM